MLFQLKNFRGSCDFSSEPIYQCQKEHYLKFTDKSCEDKKISKKLEEKLIVDPKFIKNFMKSKLEENSKCYYINPLFYNFVDNNILPFMIPKSNENDFDKIHSEKVYEYFDDLFESFIRENFHKSNYVFIDEKYSFSEDQKLICEIPKLNGTIIKFYENFMIEYFFPNNLIHKFYSDGSIISIFPNKDVRLISSNGNISYKFKTGINVSVFFEKEFSIIKYKNGTLEKYQNNGIRIIKNPYIFDFIAITFNDLEYSRNIDGNIQITKIKTSKSHNI